MLEGGQQEEDTTVSGAAVLHTHWGGAGRGCWCALQGRVEAGRPLIQLTEGLQQ